MDENKLQKLEEIGYRIPVSCGMCLHGEFAPKSDWGTCSLFQYKHKKHVGEPRQLSIHANGTCPQVEPDPSVYIELHGFVAFLGA